MIWISFQFRPLPASFSWTNYTLKDLSEMEEMMVTVGLDKVSSNPSVYRVLARYIEFISCDNYYFDMLWSCCGRPWLQRQFWIDVLCPQFSFAFAVSRFLCKLGFDSPNVILELFEFDGSQCRLSFESIYICFDRKKTVSISKMHITSKHWRVFCIAMDFTDYCSISVYPMGCAYFCVLSE